MRACGLRVNNNMVQESFEVFLCMLKEMEEIVRSETVVGYGKYYFHYCTIIFWNASQKW